ncbi:MAG: hypothetical protein QXV17_10485 [Candidatus Micrarchaeaceae archaeon]
MEDKTLIKLIAITCITLLEIINLSTLKIDSAVLAAVIGAISGLAGYEIGKKA